MLIIDKDKAVKGVPTIDMLQFGDASALISLFQRWDHIDASLE